MLQKMLLGMLETMIFLVAFCNQTLNFPLGRWIPQVDILKKNSMGEGNSIEELA